MRRSAVLAISAISRSLQPRRPSFPVIIARSLCSTQHSCTNKACADPTHVHSPAPSRATGCWSCGNCVNFFDWFCQKCDYIQPPSGETNLFRLFGLPEAFDLPDARVEKAFKTLQKFVHPDKFGNRTEREQEYSSQRSTELNRAYDILKNPVSRAQHLLFLHGIDAIGETASTAVDTRLLMEIMEKREALEEARDVTELKELQGDNDAAVCHQIAVLKRAFEAKDMILAKQATITLQYYTKLGQEIGERLLRREIASAR